MSDYLKAQKRKKRKDKRKAAKRKEAERPVYRGPKMELRAFQRVGVDFLAEHDHNVLLADAPGCGKTPQVLVAIKENTRKLCPALVVVPASVVQNWRNRGRTLDSGGTGVPRGQTGSAVGPSGAHHRDNMGSVGLSQRRAIFVWFPLPCL
jgi:superfamily II DNA or RNA helicase